MLSILPSGHLHYRLENEDNQASQQQHLYQAFSTSNAEGLLALARVADTHAWPASQQYWRDFSVSYFNLLCHQGSVVRPSAVTPPELDELEKRALSIPPMSGAEYCNNEMLYRLWIELDTAIREKVASCPNGLSEFISINLPHWHHIGRVCFHLAENKQDLDYPFAFMATYAGSMGKNSRTQYQPLSHALQEYAGKGNKKQLIKLLSPILEASKQCAWLKDLLDSRDIYHPIAWTPQEAYTLLNNVPQLESSGIIVRLPDWWKKRPRPRVKVIIGDNKQTSFNMDSLLDFHLTVALGDAPLTQKEINDLLSADSGLISLRGQWVEVDSDKLQEALTHWQSIQAEAEEGLSFIDGMRLLAGVNQELTENSPDANGQESWSYIEAGSWLIETLEKLRTPELQAKHPGKLLKATLRPYQLIGVKWLDFLTQLGLGACLADDMGLGKTIQVITLLLMKKKQRSEHRTSLLVLPASLLANWKAEFKRFSPSLKVCYMHSSEINKKSLGDVVNDLEKFDVIATTYGMLLRQPWLQEQNWNLLILDEAQAIKNPVAKQTKSVKALKCQAKIALTGTPIENRLGDLWSLFDFLCPGLLGSAPRFKKYLKNIDTDSHQPYAPLRKLVQPYILRRLKTDKRIINDLPDKTEMIAWCSLSKAQAKLYARAVDDLKQALSGEIGIKRKGLILSFMLRFKQICNHPSHALNDGHYQQNASGKFLRLAEICEEIASRQEKVLVFTQFREMTGPLSSFLTDVFGQPGLVLHGGTPVKKRKKMVDQFQTETGPPFFVLSLKAAGTGLNLTAASHVIHFDRWWNPAVETQATDRAFRIGQKKNVLVHKFVCRGTVEEKIDAMINEKVQLATDVLSTGGEALLTELDDREILDLVSLDLDQTEF